MLDRREIEELLFNAAATRFPAAERESWDYGWCGSEYRRSDRAAINTEAGPVALEPRGVESYERAVELLLANSEVRRRYDGEEFWGLVASMIATIPSEAEIRHELESRLDELLNPGYSLVVQLIANVSWDEPPVALSNMVIGKLTSDWRKLVKRSAGGRPNLDDPSTRQWLERETAEVSRRDAAQPDSATVKEEHEGEAGERTEPDKEETDSARWVWPDAKASGRPPVVVALWTESQLMKAKTESMRRLQELIDLGLFLEPDPERLEIFLVRGNRNRPGLRGLVLDRGAIGAGLAGTPWTRELSASSLVVSGFGPRSTISWHHTEPIPLDLLLGPEDRQAQVNSVLNVDTPLTRRFIIAARWYAEAYWAEETLDAVLALGIALDTLIGDPSGLPLRATSERFALLEPNSQLRSERAKRYQEIFSLRSAVAHGSVSSKAESMEYLSYMAQNVRWAAGRMLAFRDVFSPVSQDDIRRVFAELRWGTLSWN
jgi:hypothetical protein